jgi:hypothetical protein
VYGGRTGFSSGNDTARETEKSHGYGHASEGEHVLLG